MLAAMTAFLNPRRDRTELIAYLLGGAVVPAGLLIYLVSNQALAAAFHDVIRFTAARYSSIQGVPFGSFSDAQNFPLKYLFPLAALLTLLVCARDSRTCLRDRPLRSCIAFGLAGFVGCFPRPDITHIAFAAPLALPLLACLHDPAYPTVESNISLRGCRCPDRAMRALRGFLLVDIPNCVGWAGRADAARRGGVLRTAGDS